MFRNSTELNPHELDVCFCHDLSRYNTQRRQKTRVLNVSRLRALTAEISLTVNADARQISFKSVFSSFANFQCVVESISSGRFPPRVRRRPRGGWGESG